MSSSVFKDPESTKEDTMVILVNHDGSICVDHNSLQSLLNNKSVSTSLSVVRVSNNEPATAVPESNELASDVSINGEDDDHALPKVNLTLENYYSPEETRNIATSIMNFQGEVPIDTPLSLDTTDFNLFVIKNDHCYTPLTSPSQKLPVHIESPESAGKRTPDQILPSSYGNQRTLKICLDSNLKAPNKDARKISTISKTTRALPKPRSAQNELHQQKISSPMPLRKSLESQENADQSTIELQILLEDEDDFDSEHIPTSESASSDDGSDADFNVHDRKIARTKKGARGVNKSLGGMHPKAVKKIKRRSNSNHMQQDMEMESMLQAMEGGLNSSKTIRRKSTSSAGKQPVGKRLKGRVLKTPKASKAIKVEKVTSPLEKPKAIVSEPLPDIAKPVEEVKVMPKVVPPKKDKKPPAHVTEALFSDMTSLFSTPDIIKKVSTPGRLSVDQRKSIEKYPDTAITPPSAKVGKLEKRKQSKDSLSEDFTQIMPKENAFENICDTTDNGESIQAPKHLDFIDKLINADNFSEQNSSLSVPPMNTLPSLASILQASGATEAETNMDEATLLSNVVGVNLLGASSKMTSPLDAVSIQTLTSDIPDSGPLSAVSTGSLDLEENTLLESLHVAEDISEDFLMHITQTLVENSDIKAVIDKQLENSMPIEPTTPVAPIISKPKPKPIESPFVKLAQAKLASKEAAMARKEPIQIVRSDGRVITLPPIEAPATRSKRKNLPSSASTPPVTGVQSTPSTPMNKVEGSPIPKKLEVKVLPASTKKASPEFGRKRSRSNSLQKTPNNSLPESEEEDEDSDAESWRSEDDPDRLWCICQQPHNNRFMICCDKCEDWFHGKCVNVTKAMGQQMEEQGIEWTCPNCLKKRAQNVTQVGKGSPHSAAVDQIIEEAIEDETFIPLPPVPYEKSNNSSLSHTTCIVCKKEARASSIYCSDACILKHAQVSLSIISKPSSKDNDPNKASQTPTKSKFQNIIKTKSDRVIVYERTTGRCLAGDSAPTVENLEHWLKDNPTFEVVLKPGANHSISKKINPQVKNMVQLKKGTPLKLNQITLNSKLQKVHNIMKAGTQKQIVLIQPQKLDLGTPILKQSNSSITKTTSKANVIQTKPTISNKTGSLNNQASPKTAAVVTPVKPPTPKPEKAKAPAAEPIRINVRKTLKEQLMARSAESKNNKWSAEDIKKYCDETEMEMFNLFKDTDSKYKAKYRSLLFNIKDKKNFTLYKKICEGVISPKQLVRMSPDELASQELAQWRAKEAKHQLEMIKKSELDLLACAKTYVLKTHKGEEIMESRTSDMTEVDPTVAVEDVVSALNNSAVSSTSEPTETDASEAPTLLERHRMKSNKAKSHDKSEHGKTKNSSHGKDKHGRDKSSHISKTKDKDRDKTRDKSDRHNRRSDRDHRQSSEHVKSREKRNSKDKTPDTRRESSRRKSEKDIREKKARSEDQKEETKEINEVNNSNLDNSEISVNNDELSLSASVDNVSTPELPKPHEESSSEEQALPEGETYQEPTSTVTIPTPEFNESEGSSASALEEKEISEVWSGIINMIDVAHFSVTAHQVSGDCSDLTRDLPAGLDIVGRISPSTVWEYIAKMKTSNTKDIIIIQLNALNEEEKVPYIGLYSYLSSRKRLGVIKQTTPAIKDFYIFPLGTKDTIPPVLLPLSGYELNRELRPHMLLGIIVRARRKRPATSNMLTLPLPTAAKVPRKLASPPARSFTPPVNKRSLEDQGYTPPTSPRQSNLKKLPTESSIVKMSKLTESVKEKIAASLASADDNEPYSPGGSDSGDLELSTLPGSTKMPDPPTIVDEQSDLEKKMEELNRRIAEQKKQIQTMSAGIMATEHSELEEPYSPSRPVTPENPKIPALDNISLPSNLQEILASIQGKTASQPAPTSNNYYLPTTPRASNIAAEEKYTPSAPSLFPNAKQDYDLPINSKQGFNIGATNLENQIVGQAKSDVSLYTNKDNVLNVDSLNQTNVSLNLPLTDIDERVSFQICGDVDDRIPFKIGTKDVDERFAIKNVNLEEIPLINPKQQVTVLAPPPPVISEIQLPTVNKPTSKLAQLSEEELLSMVPDDILSHSKSRTVDETPNTSKSEISKGKPCTIVQSPVMYTKPPPLLIRDVPLPPTTSVETTFPQAVTSVSPPKRSKLEQPPPPGMEDFEEL